MSNPVIMWFRQDLRLADNIALLEAISSGQSVLPLFILEDNCKHGSASLWWLHHSLQALKKSLIQRGGDLILKRGNPAEVLKKIVKESGASAIYWNRRYEAADIEVDHSIMQLFKGAGIECHSYNSHLLFEPWQIKNKQGMPFQVFTPFWKTCLRMPTPAYPLPSPESISLYRGSSDNLDSWELLPVKPNWAAGFEEMWIPGEEGAKHQFEVFLESGLERYKEDRNRPNLCATSMLSPHLRWGEISPRTIWHAIQSYKLRHPQGETGADTFLSEIGWREFSYSLLYQYPSLSTQSLRPIFQYFPWEKEHQLKRWQKGLTGYPIVDAGMRQLWHTGWMHNRVRMIVASFLVKDLLIAWQTGAAWFWDTLVDADPANNAASWQWVAGCGADAAPYFRIFNPVLQGEKFDPQGDYVRQWVPELAPLPNNFIHQPWKAPPERLKSWGIVLGHTYPERIVEHNWARDRALAALTMMKQLAE